jgi:NADH dehydrogenase
MSSDTDKDGGEQELLRVDLLILGASFTGIELVHQLVDRRRSKLSIALVDRQSRHPYIPLAHERLLDRIDSASTRLESERYGERVGVRYLQGEISEFDRERHRVLLADGRAVEGRFVVVALGSEMRAPKMEGESHFLSVKSVRELERASARLAAMASEDGPGVASGRFVVVGGGISGVELAGELAHRRRVGERAAGASSVTLVHGGDRLLPGLCGRAGRLAERKLAAQGVELRLGTRVESLDEGSARLSPSSGSAGETLACDAVFWAGGVRPPTILKSLELPCTSEGWLAVSPTLQCFGDADGGDPEIFAAGDIARIQSGEGEWSTMQRAIECIWQAKLLARNISTMAKEPAGYARDGVPPLHPHTLREDFFHGVSIGSRSLLVWGPMAVDLGAMGVWFRRWLMRMYFARYPVR